MNRYTVTLRSASSTRFVTVAATDMIDARVVADRLHRRRGEQIVTARHYEDTNTIKCN